MTARNLFTLSPSLLARAINRQWMKALEQHYLISAEVEQKRAKEAMQNAAYYHKRAALARSARQTG